MKAAKAAGRPTTSSDEKAQAPSAQPTVLEGTAAGGGGSPGRRTRGRGADQPTVGTGGRCEGKTALEVAEAEGKEEAA
eukprot:COSAG04_NODE_26252_length_297_cov_0.838384_1_plen_77_part_10